MRPALLLTMIAIASAAPARGGDINGLVLMGPICPGPTRPDVDCPPQPVATIVDVFTSRADGSMSGKRVARAASDRSGRFRLSLPPGRYWLVPRTRGLRLSASGRPQDVVVSDGDIAVTLQVHTGLRGRGGPSRQ